jgi:hypothetical protein
MSIGNDGTIGITTTMGYGQEPIQGSINFIGTYSNGEFDLTTSNITSSNTSGPITLSFQPFTAGAAPNALQMILQQYQNEPCP